MLYVKTKNGYLIKKFLRLFLTEAYEELYRARLVRNYHAVKYTTIYPIQLPRTPIAVYVLVNISGKNS